jgi:predicted RNA-binding protein with PUA-like domain
MRTWLMKSEPEVFSFADLCRAPGGSEPWNGVRNYQARNFMRDAMRAGDPVLFYHSNCAAPGIVGLARIASEQARPDPTQFDPHSPFHDPRASRANPPWLLVDVAPVAAFVRPVTLAMLKADPALAGMLVTRRGMRLSIQPVEQTHFDHILRLGGVAWPGSSPATDG